MTLGCGIEMESLHFVRTQLRQGQLVVYSPNKCATELLLLTAPPKESCGQKPFPQILANFKNKNESRTFCN